MKVAFFMYDTSPLFEIVVPKFLISTVGETYIISEKEVIISEEKIKIKRDAKVSDENLFDALIVSGGDIDNLKDKDAIYNLIRNMNQQGKLIASICSGNILVNEALGLDYNTDRINDIIHISDNIIYSPATKYVELGLILGKLLNIYKDETDYQETVDFFKS